MAEDPDTTLSLGPSSTSSDAFLPASPTLASAPPPPPVSAPQPPSPPPPPPVQPSLVAKSILKRRFSSTDDHTDRQDLSLRWEGKRLRFGSEAAPSPLANSMALPADEAVKVEEPPVTLELEPAHGLDEETRQQMALLSQGPSRRRRSRAVEEGKELTELSPEPEIPELKELKDKLQKLKEYEETSLEWTAVLAPLQEPPISSNPDSRRPSWETDQSSSTLPESQGSAGSPAPPTLPSLPEILCSPLLGPQFPPVVVESPHRRPSVPDALLSRTSAAVTLASFAANPTTHRGISPSPHHHPFSPSSSSYFLPATHLGGSPGLSSPAQAVDPTLHLAPILPSQLNPSSPGYTRSNLSGSFSSEGCRRPSLALLASGSDRSLPNIPTRRSSQVAPHDESGPFTSTAASPSPPSKPTSVELLNRLRRHSRPDSEFGQSLDEPGGEGGALQLLRRHSSIVQERLDAFETIRGLVKDAEEVREDWDKGMGKI